MDIPLILGDIRPDAKWGMMGEDKGDYDNIDWRDDVMTKPTSPLGRRFTPVRSSRNSIVDCLGSTLADICQSPISGISAAEIGAS